MNETEFKVLRSNSLSELQKQLRAYESQGWVAIGRVERFADGFAQPIQIDFDMEDTEELTQEMMQDNDNSEFSLPGT